MAEPLAAMDRVAPVAPSLPAPSSPPVQRTPAGRVDANAALATLLSRPSRPGGDESRVPAVRHAEAAEPLTPVDREVVRPASPPPASPGLAAPPVQRAPEPAVIQRTPAAGAEMAAAPVRAAPRAPIPVPKPRRPAGDPFAVGPESVADQPFTRPFVTDVSMPSETAGPPVEAQAHEAPEARRSAETPEASLARMLSERAQLDIARPDLLAIAERNLFGPLPTEPAPRQVVTRPVAQEQSAGKPAFRVSIGRLEIVAPPQAAPPQQPVRPRPDPKISLQSYLDRRRQGRS